MSETPNLKLPYIMPSQAQKHVTHNEAVRALDALVQISALARNLAAPPSAPEGSRYIVAAPATGAWAGHDGDIAAWQDGAWAFLAPRDGWLAWIAAENRLVVRTGPAWGDVPAAVNPVAKIGVNATADATNRLSVAAPATLLNHEGAGHQLKINKALPADTASLLYQTGFSGRAEIGLAGSDALRVKVSADGATWKDAIVVDAATGQVTTPSTSGITVNGLLTDRTAAGQFLRIDTTPEAGRGGYEWGGWYQAAPWTNGPAGDANYVDDVFGFGLNMAGVGVKADNSRQYAAWHYESKFYGNPSQLSAYTELHFQVIDISGGNHRPISGSFRHDGLYGGLQFAFTTNTFADYAGAQRITYDFTSATQTQIYHTVRAQYNFNVNNVAVAVQRNAGDSAFLNLPYFGADDRLLLNGAFSAIGPTPAAGSYPNTHARMQSTNLPAGGILLNLVTPSVTGDTTLIQAVGLNTGESIVNVFNNASAGGNAAIELRVLDASSGDPHIRFKVNGSTNWRFGLDNSANDQLVWGTGTLGAADKMVLDTAGDLSVAGWIKSASYTVAGVPSASAAGAGAQIFVSNESGGAVMAFSDGASWRRVTDRAVIS